MSYFRFALMALAVMSLAFLPIGPAPTVFAQEPEAAAEAETPAEEDAPAAEADESPEAEKAEAADAEEGHEHEGKDDAGHEADAGVGHEGEGHGGEGHGDEGHAELPPILSFDPGAAVVNLAIFLGTFLILAKLVWPVILGGLKAREEKIAGDLRQAQDASRKAAETLAAYEKKVQEVASEAQGILAEARRDAQATATKIVDEAKADAQRQGERALADIETAKKVALAEIAGQTSALAMGVAKQVVGRELKADDHADLIKKALEQVPSNN